MVCPVVYLAVLSLFRGGGAAAVPGCADGGGGDVAPGV